MADAKTPHRLDAINAALAEMEPGDTLTACVGEEGGCTRTFADDEEEARDAWMRTCPLCERMTIGTSIGRG